MNALLTLSIILISNLSFTQDYPHELPEYLDYLLDKNNRKISCNIREIKNGKVKFLQEDKIYIKTEDPLTLVMLNLVKQMFLKIL
jgi:hypothetical protein